MEQFGTRWKDFHESLHFEYFSKKIRENSSLIKSGQE